MGFAENFIRGYTMGTHAKLAKERELREREEFETEKEFKLGQVKRQSELDKLSFGQQQQQAAIETFKLKHGSAAPRGLASKLGVRDLGEGEAGPAPSEVVMSGEHTPITIPMGHLGMADVQVQPETAETLQGRALTQKVAEAKAAQGVAREPVSITTPTAAKFLGVAPGTGVSPQELPILTAAATQRETTARAAAENALKRDAMRDAIGDPDYIADQVLNRGVEFRSLTKDQKGAVSQVLSQRGMAIPRPLTQTERNLGNNAISALNAIDRIDAMLKKDPSLPIKETVPGIGGRLLGASEYRAARNEAVDVLARARTGAAMRPDEEAYYKTQTAQAGDTEDVIARKHTQLRALYLGLSGVPVKVVAPDGTTVVYQDAYDQKQRLGIRKRIEQGWRLDY